MLYARTASAAVKASDPTAALRTECVVFLREGSPQSTGGGGSGGGGSGGGGGGGGGPVPAFWAVPTRVTLHVLHGRLWCSEAGAKAFKLLCSLARATLEATLVPTAGVGRHGARRERLVLTLSAVGVGSGSGSGSGATERKWVKVVLFPRDKTHLVKIASALLFNIDSLA